MRHLPFPRSLAAAPHLAALLAAGLLWPAPAAFGQQNAPPGPAGDLAAEADARSAPDAAAPGRNAPAPGAADAPAADPDAGPKTGPPLPRGVQPPPAKPPSFTTVTPLLSEAELTDLAARLNRARYRDVLEVGPTDANRKEIVRDWARWRVAQLTGPAPPAEDEDEEETPPAERPPLVEDRPALAKAVSDLIREANRDVGGRGGGRQAESVKLAVFPILADELLKLKDNHLVLRTQAVKILSRLEVAGDGSPGNPFKRFGPALGPLTAFFKSAGEEETELALKYQTAAMIAFVAENGRNVPGDLQIQAADLFADTLAGHPEYPGWLQGGLADAVARLNLREPTLARKLLTAVQDPERPFEARTKAAKAIVRLPGVPGDVRDALPGTLQDLGRAMAAAYNAQPDPAFVRDFRTLEFAFKPVAANETDRLRDAILSGTSVPGFLAAAYGRLHPLVKHVANQDLAAPASKWTPIPPDLLANAGVEAAG